MQKNRLIRLVIVIVLTGVFLIPAKVTCGVPGNSCAVPPMTLDGSPSYYYEIQPVGVSLIEMMTKQNTGIQYSSGTE